jgi:hypothetical protein
LEQTEKLRFHKSELVWLAGNTFYGRRGIFEPGFLEWLERFSEQALGLGKDIRFNRPEISGAALWAQERYVHICAFARDAKSSATSSFWTRISRPSHRRTF